MSLTIAEIDGEVCPEEGVEVDTIRLDIPHDGCLILKQDTEWVSLTPRMISDLIAALEKHLNG